MFHQKLREAGFQQILVTQPRRIAAISLARRVGAEQMDVAQGKVVGQRGSVTAAMAGVFYHILHRFYVGLMCFFSGLDAGVLWF